MAKQYGSRARAKGHLVRFLICLVALFSCSRLASSFGDGVATAVSGLLLFIAFGAAKWAETTTEKKEQKSKKDNSVSPTDPRV